MLAYLFQPAAIMAQADTVYKPLPLKEEKKRVFLVSAGGVMAYTASLVILSQFWYKNVPHSSFHFFNDNNEWMQMDKTGHFFTAYYEGLYGYKLMRWAGLPQKKAVLWGASWGFMLQTPIEILDGFSRDWGFSAGDLAANTGGALLAMSQEYFWQEQKILMKFSFSPSPYPAMFANGHGPLGSTFAEQMIKDYNGQTYWLSTGIYNFAPNLHIPKWLNIAVGYGADGMLRGTAEDQANDASIPKVARQRQFYLSLDVNLRQIHTRSKALNTFLQYISFVKFPAPALEFGTKDEWHFHYLYF